MYAEEKENDTLSFCPLQLKGVHSDNLTASYG
jgi:hypothetical protein